MLHQHVLAGDAQIGRAVLDIGRHVGGADDDQLHVGQVGVEDQLAAGLERIVGGAMPAAASSGRVSSRIRPLDRANGQRWSWFTPSTCAPRGSRALPDAANARAQLRQLFLDAFVAAIDVVDAIHHGVAVRHQAARIRLAEARRSVAITGAPGQARHAAARSRCCLPVSIFAPMRCSSWTCMKRFSNIVSVIVPRLRPRRSGR